MATSPVAIDGFLYSPQYPLTRLSGQVRTDLGGRVSCVPAYLFGPSKSDYVARLLYLRCLNTDLCRLK